MDGKRKKPRTLNQLRQLKTYGYRAPNGRGNQESARDKMDIIIEKMNIIDAKLEFLLNYLELEQ